MKKRSIANSVRSERHTRMLLAEYARQLNEGRAIPIPDMVVEFGRYKIKNLLNNRTSHFIGSVRSQRSNMDNRASQYIQFRRVRRIGGFEIHYGEVFWFGLIRLPTVLREATPVITGSNISFRETASNLDPRTGESDSFNSNSAQTEYIPGPMNTLFAGEKNTLGPDGHRPSDYFHYFAFIREWKFKNLDPNNGSRLVEYLGEGKLAVIPVTSIDGCVGKLKTEFGTWIVSQSIHPVFNSVPIYTDK